MQTANKDPSAKVWEATWQSLAQATPPTVREILHAYTLQGERDRDMLLTLLNAKGAEDQRIAALANLAVLQVQQSLAQLRAAPSPESSSPRQLPNPSGGGDDVAPSPSISVHSIGGTGGIEPLASSSNRYPRTSGENRDVQNNTSPPLPSIRLHPHSNSHPHSHSHSHSSHPSRSPHSEPSIILPPMRMHPSSSSASSSSTQHQSEVSHPRPTSHRRSSIRNGSRSPPLSHTVHSTSTNPNSSNYNNNNNTAASPASGSRAPKTRRVSPTRPSSYYPSRRGNHHQGDDERSTDGSGGAGTSPPTSNARTTLNDAQGRLPTNSSDMPERNREEEMMDVDRDRDSTKSYALRPVPVGSPRDGADS